MADFILNTLSTLMPLLVAIVTAGGGYLIAKLNRMQADIKTNRGSRNIGDAMDRLHDQLRDVQRQIGQVKQGQEELYQITETSQARETAIEKRVALVETRLNQVRLPQDYRAPFQKKRKVNKTPKKGRNK